jgi:hypothetical protein
MGSPKWKSDRFDPFLGEDLDEALRGILILMATFYIFRDAVFCERDERPKLQLRKSVLQSAKQLLVGERATPLRTAAFTNSRPEQVRVF